MKKYDIVIIVMTAAFLLSGSGLAAAIPDDISSPNSLSLPGKKDSPAVRYTVLSADRSFHSDPAEPLKVEPPAIPTAAPEKVPTLASCGRAFLPDIADGTKRIFSRDNAPLALIGLGLTGLAFTVDHRVQDYFQEKKPMEHSASTGDKIGQGLVPVGVGLALLGAGELWDDKKLADTGIVTLEALLVNGIATEGLKYATSRERPNGDNDKSFPSGHASMTATLAASVSEMYDWDLRIAVPLYMVTAFVGASMIQANEHYLSDVIAGVTLGTLVGTSFAKFQKEKNNADPAGNLAVFPLRDGNYKGLVVQWKF
jgi:membrane-associated phospholipid phosphatase